MTSGLGWPKVLCWPSLDDGVLGRDGREKFGGGGGVAAVVADLEERDGVETMVGEHGGFAGGFGVAFEQDAGVWRSRGGGRASRC